MTVTPHRFCLASRSWRSASLGRSRPAWKIKPRITVTYPALEFSELILFLVSGAAKRDALAQARGGELPAGRIKAQGDVLWLVDKAAVGEDDQGYGF